MNKQKWLSGECGRPMAEGLAVRSPLTAQKGIGELTAGGVAVHFLVTAYVPWSKALYPQAPQGL